MALNRPVRLCRIRPNLFDQSETVTEVSRRGVRGRNGRQARLKGESWVVEWFLGGIRENMSKAQIRKRLLNIWHDPVLSKVVAAGIIGLLTIVGTLAYGYFSRLSLIPAFLSLLNLQVPIWLIGISLISIVLLRYLFRFLLKTKSARKTVEYSPEFIPLDTVVFNQIREKLLPASGTIQFIRNFNFAGFSFESERLDDLGNFEYECQNPNFGFMHPKLEEFRQTIKVLIREFEHLIALKTFPTESGRQTIPKEWEIENPKEFWAVVKRIHELSAAICLNYDELVNSGRRILKVI
ncbi:hypothetical protein [Turneriella parva]|uniref:Uncharacterized protein n=1 Tax=Turneriella parva (strain ATCC BAA-1111 / DSM 21527 / NCTC 11395 / H) TaxID=869212 RepID=I4B5H8_TURPD|nr:hypothetical protein [Turneriella parva]AFM12535.1 hypothetical protein Turpa_1888 [Turneriella parva DSM 21527]